jgi:hypothetical protein
MRIYLPVVEESEGKRRNEPMNIGTPLSQGVITILMVDDNADVRQIGISMLEAL